MERRVLERLLRHQTKPQRFMELVIEATSFNH
jgi:hypothetical protein